MIGAQWHGAAAARQVPSGHSRHGPADGEAPIMDLASLNAQSYAVIAVVSVAGALLGGAIAHWRRGAGFIATGAIIGGLAAFLFGLAGTIYSGFIYALGGVVVLLVIAYGWLSG